MISSTVATDGFVDSNTFIWILFMKVSGTVDTTCSTFIVEMRSSTTDTWVEINNPTDDPIYTIDGEFLVFSDKFKSESYAEKYFKIVYKAYSSCSGTAQLFEYECNTNSGIALTNLSVNPAESATTQSVFDISLTNPNTNSNSLYDVQLRYKSNKLRPAKKIMSSNSLSFSTKVGNPCETSDDPYFQCKLILKVSKSNSDGLQRSRLYVFNIDVAF